MKAKKSFVVISSSIIIVFLLTVFVFTNSSVASQSSNPKMSELGAMYARYYQSISPFSEDETYYAVGKTISIPIDEMRRALEYYQIGGMGSNATTLADKYVKERNALYAEAISNGFTATDTEIRQYLEDLKDLLYNAENKDDIFATIRGFGSEEAYWNYEYFVYQKEYPIIKYTTSLRENYFSSSDDLLSEEGWQTYFTNLKNALVQQQNFVIVNDVQ